MTRTWYQRVETRVGVALATALLVAVVWRGIALRRADLAFWGRALTGTASVVDDMIERWLVERREDARLAAILLGSYSSGPDDTGRWRWADSILAAAAPPDRYEGAWLVDSVGGVIAQSDSAARPSSREIAATITAIRVGQGGVLSNLHGGAAPTIAILTVVDRQRRGDPVGAGLAIVMRAHFDPFIIPLMRSRLRASVTAQGFIIERNGTSITALTPAPPPAQRFVRRTFAWDSAPTHFRLAALGADTAVQVIDVAGTPVYASLRSVRGADWGVIRQAHMSEVFARLKRQIAVEAGLAIAVTLTIVWILVAHRHAENVNRLRLRLVRVQLDTLKAQLRPHFLFNVLNAAVELINRDPVNAERMVLQLSTLLRLSLQTRGEQEVPLRQELDLIHVYCDIERLRFKDGVRFVIEAPPETLDAFVPALLLQPLVENAVRHGVGRRGGRGVVRVSVSVAEKSLALVVEDDGPGFVARDAPTGLGLGLRNTRRRLRRLYGRRHTLALENRPHGGARVRVQIPLAFAPVGQSARHRRGTRVSRGVPAGETEAGRAGTRAHSHA